MSRWRGKLAKTSPLWARLKAEHEEPLEKLLPDHGHISRPNFLADAANAAEDADYWNDRGCPELAELQSKLWRVGG